MKVNALLSVAVQPVAGSVILTSAMAARYLAPSGSGAGGAGSPFSSQTTSSKAELGSAGVRALIELEFAL